MNALSTTFADLTETLRICSTGREPNHLFGGTRVFHTVSVEGKMYRVSDRELALLKSGMTPDDLELDPEDEEEDDEREQSPGARTSAMARSGAFGGR